LQCCLCLPLSPQPPHFHPIQARKWTWVIPRVLSGHLLGNFLQSSQIPPRVLANHILLCAWYGNLPSSCIIFPQHRGDWIIRGNGGQSPQNNLVGTK
jgi:hypothetical protein